MPDLDSLPTELFFGIIAYLPLKALIYGRSVNRNWRNLIFLANISPARRSLLDFYYGIIENPAFINSRKNAVILNPFDRELYVSSLETQIGETLPDGKSRGPRLISLYSYLISYEEFRTWVIEWPEKAILTGHWPGLPLHAGNRLTYGRAGKFNLAGGNIPSPDFFEAYASEKGPHLWALELRDEVSQFDIISWLLVSRNSMKMSGIVYAMGCDGYEEHKVLANSWVEWLRILQKEDDVLFERSLKSTEHLAKIPF